MGLVTLLIFGTCEHLPCLSSFCVFDFLGMVFLAMEPDVPGGPVERSNTFASFRKQTLQIAEHFRDFDDFLDSDTLLEACSLLHPAETGLFLVVTPNEKLPYLHARTFRLSRWTAFFRLPPNAWQASQPREVRCHLCCSRGWPLHLGGARRSIQRDRAEREAHVPWFHAFISCQGFQLFQGSTVPLHVFGASPRIVKIRPSFSSALGEHDEIDQL
jgi:hypothetical protein